jgi:hypothetical protein
MNETLETKIKEMRILANDTVPEENEDWCYSTGELCDRASHEARIELAKEAISIIDELQKENKEGFVLLDRAMIGWRESSKLPMELAQDIVKLRDEIDLAIETLRCYAKSDNSELAKETLIKLNASL